MPIQTLEEVLEEIKKMPMTSIPQFFVLDHYITNEELSKLKNDAEAYHRVHTPQREVFIARTKKNGIGVSFASSKDKH